MLRIIVATVVFMIITYGIAFGRELYPGQYAQVDPAVRQWFRQQTVPGGPHKGFSCCSEADGTYAEEDIRADPDGSSHYWVRFEAYGRPVDWMKVPDEAVITEPNRHGRAVVWFAAPNDGGLPVIRCFIPGAGI